MRVLVACEFSGIVRDAFIRKGHYAVSCDLLPTELPGPHHQGDVLEFIRKDDTPWDLMIAHPPCTYLTIANASNYTRNEKLRELAIEFWLKLNFTNISKIALENPVPFLSVQEQIGKYDQIINPFDFGTPERKRICLWLKNLPNLKPTNRVCAKIKKTYIRKTGKKAGQSYNTYYHQGKSAHERSRFFKSIADAMADQWGDLK